ncbi:MAG: LPXTG cell wall anchor domain-containing protein, partial [Eubacterium sp.]|nr:LPXTG cell wall anchor domain-containing protein [Eubacterium sp.]
NQLFENTADVYVSKVPSKDDVTGDTHTSTDVPRHIPFTVSWIGPKLSDYMVYAGNKENITGDVGIVCYGDDDFSGKVVAKVTFGAEEIAEVEKDVTIAVGENNKNIEGLYNFKAEKLGEYTVTATLFDKEGKVVSEGSKIVKVIEKNKIDFIANSKISDEEERTVDFSWNDISDSLNIYNYRLYRRYENHDWEPRSIWNEKDKIKVLNVYPTRSPLLVEWMNTTVSETEQPAGMGMFDIDSVYYADFNRDPERYMFDGDKWRYDVVFYGARNCGFELSQKAYEVTDSFVDSGRGVLFGHDTVAYGSGHTYFNKFADKLGILIKNGNCNTNGFVTVTKIGTLTNFPWTIRGTLKVPLTHTSGQYAGGSLPSTEWMRIDSWPVVDKETNAQANFYLVTNNNLGLIQTGHSDDGQATDDERKVFANTLFYLHQTSQLTTAKDNSFYDLAAPEKPDVKFVSINGNNVTFDIFSKDNGTTYQYYIKALSSKYQDDEGIRSNIVTNTALSGIKGYVYAVNENSEEDMSVLEYDENGECVLNTVTPDENGNLRIDLDVSSFESNYYLHVYAVDNENNISGEVIKNLGEGELSPNIETDKDYYIKGETAKINALTSVMQVNTIGDVSVSLYDGEDRFVEELFSENNQKVSVDEPYTVETELDLDDTFDGDYKVKIEWEVAGGQSYSDTADFTVGAPKTPESHTSTDAGKTPDKPGSTNVTVGKTVDSKKDVTTNPPKKSDPEPTTSATKEPTTQTTTQTTTQATTEEPADITTEEPTDVTTSTEAPVDNPQTDPTNTAHRTPNTGDDMNTPLVVLMMSIAAGVILICIKRKRDNYVQH